MKVIKLFIIYYLVIITLFINSCSTKQSTVKESIVKSKDLVVHFIDVGKADCILIQYKDEAILIDAGYEEQGEMIVSYIKKQGISKLRYLVATHPDKDHIGGMPKVIESLSVETLLMPKVEKDSAEYTNLQSAIKRNNIAVTVPKVLDKFNLGKVNFTVLAPNSSNYEDINNYSIVLKAEYGSKSFLFMGDALEESENEIIKSGYNLKADVLKVAHHGSNSASKKSFLKLVAPEYAVIMVGDDKEGQYADEKVIKRLKDQNSKVYRTDKDGTIIMTTDGINLSVETKKK